MKSVRGIYYNLEESEYIFKIERYEFTFSSIFYKEKFIKSYDEEIKKNNYKMKYYYHSDIDTTFISLLRLYKHIEKRGFLVKYDGIKLKNPSFSIEMK